MMVFVLIAVLWQWWCWLHCSLLALNAAEKLIISHTTTRFITFTWSFPAGYFEGFNITGIPSSNGAVGCRATVYGKTYQHTYVYSLLRAMHA